MGVFWGEGDEPGPELEVVQKARNLIQNQIFRRLPQRSSDGRRVQDLEKGFLPHDVHFFSQTVLKITT